VEVIKTRPEWEKQLAGGFAYMTAPFAEHPSDQKRAKKAIELAREAGITHDEFCDAARKYIETAKGWPTDIDQQMVRVNSFVQGKL